MEDSQKSAKNLVAMGIGLAFSVFAVSIFLPVSSASASTILDAYKYAWSNNVG